MHKTLEKVEKLVQQLNEIVCGLNYYRQFLDEPNRKEHNILGDTLRNGYDFKTLGFDNTDEILELTKCVVEILHKRSLIVCNELKEVVKDLNLEEGLRTR